MSTSWLPEVIPALNAVAAPLGVILEIPPPSRNQTFPSGPAVIAVGTPGANAVLNSRIVGSAPADTAGPVTKTQTTATTTPHERLRARHLRRLPTCSSARDIWRLSPDTFAVSSGR